MKKKAKAVNVAYPANLGNQFIFPFDDDIPLTMKSNNTNPR